MNGNYPYEREFKYLKFSRKAFSFIINLLLELMDGSKIVSNNSLIKTTDFDKQLLREDITIKNIIKNKQLLFNSEGIMSREKILIERGVLKECLNDIQSAKELGLYPGNSHYDYILGYNINKSDTIVFEYSCNDNQEYNYDAYIYDVLDEHVIIDGDSGFVGINFLGVNNMNDKRKYYIYHNIFDIFNNIVKSEGELKQYETCIVPKVIIDLGGETMIRAIQVSFSYEKGKRIINKFTYDFDKKDSYVIVGDNGTGKTTLLRLLLGILKPDEGEVEMNDGTIVGYVPDYNGLYENLSLIDNVKFRLGIYNKSLSEVNDLFEQWISRYGLDQYKNSYVRNMSLGTKKKVGLLCTLLTMPDLLVLDEPTGGLDQSSKIELIDILKEFKSKMMIIAVTHDKDYIEAMGSVQINI